MSAFINLIFARSLPFTKLCESTTTLATMRATALVAVMVVVVVVLVVVAAAASSGSTKLSLLKKAVASFAQCEATPLCWAMLQRAIGHRRAHIDLSAYIHRHCSEAVS